MADYIIIEHERAYNNFEIDANACDEYSDRDNLIEIRLSQLRECIAYGSLTFTSCPSLIERKKESLSLSPFLLFLGSAIPILCSLLD